MAAGHLAVPAGGISDYVGDASQPRQWLLTANLTNLPAGDRSSP